MTPGMRIRPRSRASRYAHHVTTACSGERAPGFVSLSPEPPSIRTRKTAKILDNERDLFHRIRRRRRHHRSGHPQRSRQVATRTRKTAVAPPCGHSPLFGAGPDSRFFRWHRSRDCSSIRITGGQSLRRRAQECRIGCSPVRMRGSDAGARACA